MRWRGCISSWERIERVGYKEFGDCSEIPGWMKERGVPDCVLTFGESFQALSCRRVPDSAVEWISGQI